MPDELLDISSLSVAYGPVVALRDISMDLALGEAVFVVGSNGAGKTTLLRTISGLEPPVQGSIRFLGRDITKSKPWDIAKLGIAHVPQGRRCFGPLSVEENLLMGGYRQPERTRHTQLARVYEIFPALRDKRNQAASELSGGQQQMVAIGRALMAQPRLLLLDEPSLGLAPLLVKELAGVLQALALDAEMGIIIVEQNVHLAMSVAGRGYVLHSGRSVLQGKADDLADSLHDVYLGKTGE